MRPLLILLLVFSFFSCNKDESDLLSKKHSKEEIFNAVVGTWKFSRLGYDAEFKKIKKIDAKECTEYDRNIFGKDGTLTRTSMEHCSEYDPIETGSFYIRFGGYFPGDTDGTYVMVKDSGVFLCAGLPYMGWLTLHSFTDSTLVFSDVKWESEDGPQYDEFNLFTELKRVK